MFGKFIFECDTENFDLAIDAAKYLLENPEHKDVVTSQSSGGEIQVSMFSRRLKRSISVRQVKP